MKKVLTATCAVRDRYKVSIEGVNSPSTFYMNSAVGAARVYMKSEICCRERTRSSRCAGGPTGPHNPPEAAPSWTSTVPDITTSTVPDMISEGKTAIKIIFCYLNIIYIYIYSF